MQNGWWGPKPARSSIWHAIGNVQMFFCTSPEQDGCQELRPVRQSTITGIDVDRGILGDALQGTRFLVVQGHGLHAPPVPEEDKRCR
jgi:hypothetical protein